MSGAGCWFKADIANALLATYQSQTQGVRMFGGNSKESKIYLAGVRDVISTIALSFGISPALVIPDAGNGYPQLE